MPLTPIGNPAVAIPGTVVTFTAASTDSAGNSLSGLVTWALDNASCSIVATSIDTLTVSVLAVKPGTATLTATAAPTGYVATAAAQVQVVTGAPSDITLTHS